MYLCSVEDTFVSLASALPWREILIAQKIRRLLPSKVMTGGVSEIKGQAPCRLTLGQTYLCLRKNIAF